LLFAREIVARFHSARAAEAAVADFEARFKRGDLPENIPEVTVKISERERKSPDRVPELAITKILKESQLVFQRFEALRMIEQGGVRINGEKVIDQGTDG